MVDKNYSKACTETLEIISHFSEEEYSKISKDRIEFLEENKDLDYEYTIDPEVDLSKQKMSKETKAMILEIYRDYFASKHQQDVLDDILMQNQVKLEREKGLKYNPNDIFKNDIKVNQNEEVSQVVSESIIDSEEENTSNQLVQYKESFFVKLKRFIFRLLHIKEKE